MKKKFCVCLLWVPVGRRVLYSESAPRSLSSIIVATSREKHPGEEGGGERLAVGKTVRQKYHKSFKQSSAVG